VHDACALGEGAAHAFDVVVALVECGADGGLDEGGYGGVELALEFGGGFGEGESEVA